MADSISRRKLIVGGASVAALAVSGCEGPWFRTSKSPRLKLRWLGWEHYDVPRLREQFEQEHGVTVSAGYFDGNSEAYTRLKSGGVREFDLVMADGFWPRLYYSQDLTQPLIESKLPNLGGVFGEFLQPDYSLLHAPDGSSRIAAPNCWGGYGITANIDEVPEGEARSLKCLFDSRFARRIATSARFEENIALAGILACHVMGTKASARPDGKAFNPYVLFDEELEYAKQLLIKQKRSLLARWNDEDTLERLLRSKAVWISPEWSGIYRRIHFDYLDGETDLRLRHFLRPTEGGLGWVDTWAITSGVEDSEKIDLAHQWIDFRLRPASMALVAKEIGWSPTVDVRSLLEERYVETLFLNQTSAIADLYQFDVPSSTDKWERVWSEVETA